MRYRLCASMSPYRRLTNIIRLSLDIATCEYVDNAGTTKVAGGRGY